MSINKIVLETDGLVVGDSQLVTSGGGVSVGKNSVIEDCRIENSIIQNDSLIKYKVIGNSMIGSNAILAGKPGDVSLGDYSAEA